MKARLFLASSLLILSSTSASGQVGTEAAEVAALRHIREELDLKGRLIIDARTTGDPGKVNTSRQNDNQLVNSAAKTIGAQVGSLEEVMPCNRSGCPFDADAVLAFHRVGSSADAVVVRVVVWFPTTQPSRMSAYWIEYEVTVQKKGGAWVTSSKMAKRS